MTRSTMSAKSLWRRIAVALGTTVFWVAVWYGLALVIDETILIPTPLLVLETLCRSVVTLSFWKTVGMSLLRIAVGFSSAVLVGTVCGILTSRYRTVRTVLAPILHVIRVAPVASFIIMTLVWIPYDGVPTFIAFLTVLPIVWLNVERGILQTDRQLLEMAVSYRLPFSKILTSIYLPSVKPFFLTAAVNGLGFAWKSGVAAEVICRPEWSIGKQLQDAKVYLETPEVFAWTAVVILLSLLLERLLLHVTEKGRRQGGVADAHL